ncbi:hypothetical protein [Paraburkholderia sp. GAS82]|uniref:hypothetical protein n=1 Tax=Paraburkholderia sp. GAS82 TaxID=3035137 RepID=UPI003D1D740C
MTEREEKLEPHDGVAKEANRLTTPLDNHEPKTKNPTQIIRGVLRKWENVSDESQVAEDAYIVEQEEQARLNDAYGSSACSDDDGADFWREAAQKRKQARWRERGKRVRDAFRWLLKGRFRQ